MLPFRIKHSTVLMIDISDLCSSRVLSQSLEIMVSMGLYSLDFAAQKLSG